MAQYDDVLVYIDFQEAQAINSININEITNFEIMLDDVTMAKSVGAELEQYLGYPFFAITVFDSHQYIFTWIEMQKQPIPIVLGIIMIIASFNIITTLLIMVLEKLPHIGVLRALGFTKNQIVRLFLMQGLNIAIKGVLIGGSIAFIFSYLQLKYHFIKLNGDIYFLDVLPIKIIPFHYILVISITLILSLLATIIPAIIASRINIIKALKFR
jgi:lipoprotein-releasing system permease protein